jgi:hypothetical protein
LRCAPRISCSRRIDYGILALPVKDTDWLLLGSAHPVPGQDWVVSYNNSPWLDVYNSPWLDWKAIILATWLQKQGRSVQSQERFLGQLAG